MGFKYIGATMDAEGPEKFVFGCEESLGYLAGTYARDKDAAIAALYAAELASELRRDGKTLLDRLEELYAQQGVFLEDQVSLTCPGPRGNQQIADLMQLFRDNPPERIGDLQLERLLDYQRHEIRAIPGNRRLGDLPKPFGNLLIAEGAVNGCQAKIALRPSGTEPKIKFYLYLNRSATGSATGPRDLVRSAMSRMRSAVHSWAIEAVGDR